MMSNSTKIQSVAFQKMRNLAHYTFMWEVKEVLMSENITAIGFETMLSAFNQALVNEGNSLYVRRKSELTSELVKLNQRREEIYAGMYYHYQSSLLHYEEPIREAARGISHLMKSIAKMHNTSNIVRNTQINKITYNIRRLPEQMAILGLEGWLDALDAVNEQYQQVFGDRIDEQSKKGNGNVLSTRVVLDRQYQGIVALINALVLVEGSEKYQSLVRRINCLIDREKRRIAIREGIRRYKKAKAQAAKESTEQIQA